MIAMKACPRCRGDLHLGGDSVFSCLQCGCELEVEKGHEFKAKLEAVRRRRLATAA